MTVAEGLRRFRREKKLTQSDVAKALGIHQQAYQRYEVGKVLPIITLLIKMAEVYNVSIDYLVGRTSEKIPNEETIQAIEEAERGEGLSRTFTTVDEVMDALNAPD